MTAVREIGTAVLLIGLGLAAGPIAASPAPATARAEGQDEPDASTDALVLLDLSGSMARTPTSDFIEIVSRVLQELPPGATFTIRVLQSSNTDARSLLAERIPRPVRTTDKIAANQLRATWMKDLTARLEEQRRRPALPPGLSCYVKSLEFASGYFESRGREHRTDRTRVVWVGDLIEDCRDPEAPEYSRIRLTRWKPGSAPSLVKQLPRPPRLESSELAAVIVPRAEEVRREVDGDIVVAYWREMLPLLGVGKERLRIGMPDVIRLGAARSVRDSR